MSWSEERLEALKRLAGEGWSASQIAGEIGLSRNAVIGKAHRMGIVVNSQATFRRQRENEWREAERALLLACLDEGLSAGTASDRLMAAGFRRSRLACVNRAQLEGRPFRARPLALDRPALAFRPVPLRRAAQDETPAPRPPRAICTATNDPPPEGGVSLLDLEFHHCRWPMGDPHAESFRFCGGHALEGKSYCAAHARLAYVPVQARVREARPRDVRDNRRMFA